ncbi:hypothetical protein PHISCL_07632 [Aspergillus sclerotialis]|uniref:Uncharacterized protein n=1 Tax=Aspergillus sclerotialis TaxID=2070753 RepID=A0A3A2ZSJ1_9EURO|nr:hypothetical protein PHISCL_07632 [Aspergillus sclerotialis]
MAPPLSFLQTLSLVFTLLNSNTLVTAAPWIVTEAYQEVVTTLPAYYSHSTVTRIQEVTPTATSLPEAISTITAVTSDYAFRPNDITIVQKLYPTGIGEAVDPYNKYHNGIYESHSGEYHMTVYKVNLTYTAPTGCSTQWTRTTAASVFPPAQIEDLLPRTAVETSISIDSRIPFQPITNTYDVIFVDPTQLPSTSLESLSYSHRPTAMYTGGPHCEYYSDDYTYPSSSYYGYDGDDRGWFFDSYYMGISPFALTLTLTIGWVGLMIILGFIEAFIRFRRLMTGWQTRRGLPVFWSLTIMPITFLLLCFFRKGYRARSQADAEILRRRWAAMSLGTKLRLFFVWGFRFKYPPMLGPAPALVKASKRPEHNPGPRLLTPSDQGSTTEAERERSGSRGVSGGADPEMVQTQTQTQAEGLSQVESGPALSHRDEQIGWAR